MSDISDEYARRAFVESACAVPLDDWELARNTDGSYACDRGPDGTHEGYMATNEKGTKIKVYYNERVSEEKGLILVKRVVEPNCVGRYESRDGKTSGLFIFRVRDPDMSTVVELCDRLRRHMDPPRWAARKKAEALPRKQARSDSLF